MNTYVPINCLNVGEKYNQIFLIHAVANKVGKQNGVPYKLLTLKDVTGTLNAALFDFPEELSAGQWVYLGITIESYNKKKHGVINSINCVSTAPDNVIDYIDGPNENVLNVYTEYIKEAIASIQDPFYRDVVNNADQHAQILTHYQALPYANQVNDVILAHSMVPGDHTSIAGAFAYRGGLLIHTYLLLNAAMSMGKLVGDNISRRIDTSLIVAGCLFRNCGFMSIMGLVSSHWSPLDSARLIGLRTASFMLVNHLIISTESDMKIVIPEPKKLALQNIVLASNMREAASLEARIILGANETIDYTYHNMNSAYEHITK